MVLRARSHPSWVCGLKLGGARVRGGGWVTPFVGVWIETGGVRGCEVVAGSHPSWVCGLKQQAIISYD